MTVTHRLGRSHVRRFAVGTTFVLLALSSVWQTAEADTATTCAPPASGEPMFITEDCVDPRFNDAYAFIDVDEVRQAPVPHRFVYGGFRGTDARFAYYFPSAEQYRGRFYLGPVHQLRLTGEVAFPNEIREAFDSGAYLIETNNAGYENCLTARDGVEEKCDPTVRGYRFNAAAAKFSRQLAKQIYGTDERPYGYLYGGSGGAYMTLATAEHTSGVFDGYVPFVMGDPQAFVGHFAVRAHALRVLGDKMADVVDAMDVGGSGDPYQTLTPEQADALREATRFGFPLRGWFSYRALSDPGSSMVTSDYVKLLDPTYLEDFWTKPGYLGTEQSPAGDAIRVARIKQDATIVAAAPYAPPPAPTPLSPPYEAMGPAYPYFMVGQYGQGMPPKAFVVDSLPEGDLRGALIHVMSGPQSGNSCPLSVVNAEAKVISCGGNSDPRVINGLGPGDTVRIDNGFFLAFQTQPRHELPPAEWGVRGYEQYRRPNGKPKFPQRGVFPALIGGLQSAGANATGEFFGKMIVMNTLLDQDAYAYPADWYRQQAAKHGRANDVRVWFVDNAVHGGVPDATRTIDYLGVLHQALRDLAAWVEMGVPPPSSTNFSLDRDTQIHLPAAAAERGGIQPVVDLKANGMGGRVEVRAGEPVAFEGTITVPPGTGNVVCAEWDLEGTGQFATASQVLPPIVQTDPGGGAYSPLSVAPPPGCEAGGAQETVQATHTYTEPGTYFAVLRGTSQRDGDVQTNWARIQNLARVRVVVS